MASLFEKFKKLILHSSKDNTFSPTVELAVDKIMSDLSVSDRTKISNMDENRLKIFHQNYGIFIKNEFRLWVNTPLKNSCCEVSGLPKVNPDLASYIILKELQKKIQQTDVPKIVK
jgi:uncharacterized protein DUF6794